jgi:hypothetical protein
VIKILWIINSPFDQELQAMWWCRDLS